MSRHKHKEPVIDRGVRMVFADVSDIPPKQLSRFLKDYLAPTPFDSLNLALQTPERLRTAGAAPLVLERVLISQESEEEYPGMRILELQQLNEFVVTGLYWFERYPLITCRSTIWRTTDGPRTFGHISGFDCDQEDPAALAQVHAATAQRDSTDGDDTSA